MKGTNDTTIDLLLRRFAQGNSSVSQGAGELHNHLDPDELNAFAENVLPEAARTRFASHLADCHRCRKLATELTMSAPVAMRVQPESVPGTSFWSSAAQVLAGLVSLPVLRFGVPALAILLLAIVAFVALRRPTDGEFVAQKQVSSDVPTQERPSALATPESSTSEAVSPAPGQVGERTALRAPSVTPTDADKSDVKEKIEVREKGLDRGYAGAANTVSNTQPVFAEPKAASNERDDRAQNAPAAKAAPSEYQVADRARSEEVTRRSIDGLMTQKDDQLGKRNRDVGPSPPAKMGAITADSKAKGPQRSRDESQSEGRGAGGVSTADTSTETRKISGRTFRRQGNTWIDAKFNSSMSVTNLPRGSEQYRSLTADESGLRAIGEQLSNVIVVWKGKAYRIH